MHVWYVCKHCCCIISGKLHVYYKYVHVATRFTPLCNLFYAHFHYVFETTCLYVPELNSCCFCCFNCIARRYVARYLQHSTALYPGLMPRFYVASLFLNAYISYTYMYVSIYLCIYIYTHAYKWTLMYIHTYASALCTLALWIDACALCIVLYTMYNVCMDFCMYECTCTYVCMLLVVHGCPTLHA